MNIRKISVVLCVFLLVAIIMVPVVSAGIVGTLPEQSSDQFMEWAYSMEGKEVTAGQCLEKNAPGYWANLSDEQKKAYTETVVVLPDFHKFKQDTSVVSAPSSNPDTSSQDPKALAVIVYMATANSGTGAIPYGINYWASTANTCNGAPCAFPVTNIIADLMRWDGSKWVRADGGTQTGYYTSFVEVWKNKFFPASGYYSTFSQHYGDFPPGATPPAYYLSRWSNTVYYS
jgi:nitrate reductase NapE component